MNEIEYIENRIKRLTEKLNYFKNPIGELCGISKEDVDETIYQVGTELATLESIKAKLEANQILSRAIDFVDEGDFQSGHLNRVIFNDMVDDKEKSILDKAFKENK